MTDNALTKPPVNSSLPVLSTTENLNQGTRLKFTDGRWISADGRDMNGAKLLVIHMTRGLRRWHIEGGPEDMSEDAGPLPDHEALNETIPKTEWRRSLNGDPEPPWQVVYPVYFIDLNNYEIFTSLNSTWGQKIAWDKLKTQIRWCSTVKKTPMHPMVKLGSANMGGKMAKLRPDFAIVPDEWVSFEGGINALPAPTLKEEMGGDEIPFDFGAVTWLDSHRPGVENENVQGLRC